MKLIYCLTLIAMFLVYQTKSQCTQEMQVECVVDIQRSVKFCAQAFSTEGSDIVADIKCVQYLLKDKNHCWPCICAEAQKKHWKIIGCENYSK